jgi:hypothetical protein
VVAADRQQPGAAAARLVGGALDRADRVVDVERVDPDVTRVGHLLGRERGDAERRVVRAQQLRRRADVPWSEACAGPVGHPGVERQAEHRDVDVLDLVGAGEPVPEHRSRTYRHGDRSGGRRDVPTSAAR